MSKLPSRVSAKSHDRSRPSVEDMYQACKHALDEYLIDRDRREQMEASFSSYDRNDAAHPTHEVYQSLGYKVFNDDLDAYLLDRDRRERAGGPLLHGRIYDRDEEAKEVYQPLAYKIYTNSFSWHEYLRDRDRREQMGGPLVYGPIYDRGLTRPPMDVDRNDNGEGGRPSPAVDFEVGGSREEVIAEGPRDADKPWKSQIIKFSIHDWPGNASSSSSIYNTSPQESKKRRSPHTGKRQSTQRNTIKARRRDSRSLRDTTLRAMAPSSIRANTRDNRAHHETTKVESSFPRSGSLQTLHDRNVEDIGRAQATNPLFIERSRRYLDEALSMARRR